MKILRKLCIFIVIVALYPKSSTEDEDKNKENTPNDHETELLDKEYGVKYASACEGNYRLYSFI